MDKKAAVAVPVQRFAEAGPGLWWFVHHPDNYLIEIGADSWRAEQVAKEINAGRAALAANEDKCDGR